MITQPRLKELLSYDPTTGHFTWLMGWSRTPAGSRAGTVTRNAYGYRYIMIPKRFYAAHQLAWLFMTGRWPTDEIDHINRQADDNRFVNLRECTRSQNQANIGLSKANKSGIKGVHKCTKSGRWRALIKINGRIRNLGFFDDLEEAAAAYREAAAELFGEFSHAA